MTDPPFSSLAAARSAAGDAGVRALVPWILAQPSYSAAARALGTRPGALRRACELIGSPLPKRAPGTPKGTAGYERAMARRARGGA